MTVHKFESSRKTTVEINEYKHIKRKNMKNNPQKKILRQDGFPIGAEMAKKRYSSAGTTTPFLKQLILTILLFAILPVTALAAEGAPNTLYVGNMSLPLFEDSYWATNDSGELTRVNDATDDSNDWNVKYDPSTATLTLKDAKISGSFHQYNNPFTAGIYALCSSNQPVALTIELIGTNTITGHFGIYVNAEIDTSIFGADASLSITGDGSLEVSGSSHGIYVKSGTGNASLTINDASVVAKTTQTYSGGSAGVYVQSSIRATSSPQLSLAVNGGSLTASGTGSSDGIWFYVGSSQASKATTSLTVSDNAIVRANGGIKASRVNEPTPSGTGIVFDGTEGTVYGNVELQKDLEIKSGETLTIPEGASLNTNGKLTVNGGTLNGTPSGDVTYKVKVTGVSLNKGSLTLDVGESETLNATVQPDNATNKNVTWSSKNADVATVGANGKVTAVGEGNATITVTTEDGSLTATCTVTVHTWGDVSYEWSKDDEGNQTCTATRTCKNDEKHVESATATVTGKQTTAPTCTEMGETTYTAKFNEDWAKEQTKTVMDIDATGHGETKIQNAKEPTCTADGYTGDKVCVVCDDVVESGTVIPATGHDYENGYCTICGEKDPDYVEPEPEPEPEPTYYRVDLRPVEGATVILSADEVEEGGTLTFTIEIAEGYVADDLMVTVSQGIGKAVEVKPDEAGVYTVKEVDGLVTITVYGVTEEPATAIERVETLRIYAAEGILHVETPTRQRVTIVSMAGALIADGEQEGARIYRDLNAGVYIVRVGDYATKVRVE